MKPIPNGPGFAAVTSYLSHFQDNAAASSADPNTKIRIEQTWEISSLSSVRVLATAPGRVLFTLTVSPTMCNSLGTLHGGCAATLLDVLTSMAAATVSVEQKVQDHTSDRRTPDVGGLISVTRALNLTYLRGTRAGEKLVCDVAVMARGKRSLALEGRLIGRASRSSDRAPDKDDIIATALGGQPETRVMCIHDKAVIGNTASL